MRTTEQVSYGLKNGDQVENVGWAAKMVFAETAELKLSRYQVRQTALASACPDTDFSRHSI